MPKQPHSNRGFTLLELLVVVAVIALLLGILLPALSAASEAGRSAVCGSNLNQLAQGALAYSEENDYFMPWYAFSSRRPEGLEWWVTQVARSMDQFEPNAYACTSDPLPYEVPIYFYNGLAYMNDGREYTSEGTNPMTRSPNDRPVRAEHADGRNMWLKVSYRGSCSLTIGMPNEDGLFVDHVRRITEFTQPNKVIQVVEGVQTNQYEKNGYTMQECMNLMGLKSPERFDSWKRHFGTSNVSFMDGHIERLTPFQLAEIGPTWRR